jgi:hypothetical protein
MVLVNTSDGFDGKRFSISPNRLDSVGIRLPKLGAKKEVFLDLIQTHKPQCTERIR